MQLDAVSHPVILYYLLVHLSFIYLHGLVVIGAGTIVVAAAVPFFVCY